MEGLFRGTWYRSAVKLEGETIIPIPPFEIYNPFDLYYSASDIRQGQRSLYLEFLNVNSNKPEEIISFCERFGMLGDPEQAKTQAKYLRRLTAQHLSEGSNRLSKRDKKDFIEKMEKMAEPNLGIPEECSFPVTISSFKTKQEEFYPLKVIFPATLVSTDSQPIWISVMTERTNHFLAESNVIPKVKFNFQQNKWELVWASNSLIGYLTLMLMLDLLGPGEILSCPRCQKFFVTASNRVKYCSPSCYENFKVQKYQNKKKTEKLAAQKGKKSKATKSTGKKR